ncbi:MAG: hypothetical protein MSH33_04750 [Fusobacterium necrophorum]|nr:hypothetical protein [Fusobacterium necrophorum]
MQIINITAGIDVLDANKADNENLTPNELIELIEADRQLARMDRMRRERKYKAREVRKLKNSIAYKMCLLCGLPL